MISMFIVLIWLWVKTLAPKRYPKIAGIYGCLIPYSYVNVI